MMPERCGTGQQSRSAPCHTRRCAWDNLLMPFPIWHNLRRELPDLEVKAQLIRFKGVGAKTISCVLLFCLQRADFPVDTHVWKIALALGWVPRSASRDQTYQHLNTIVPDEIKYPLHVMLVQYGKQEKNDVRLLRSLCIGGTPAQVD
jgi:endonuclease III